MSVNPETNPPTDNDLPVDSDRSDTNATENSSTGEQVKGGGESVGEEDRSYSGLPRGPRVFGRFAVFITIVPMIFYLAGNMFFSYLESSRAHTCVKEQTLQTKAFLLMRSNGIPGLKARLMRQYRDESKVDEAVIRYNITAIESLFEAETWEAEELEKIVGPILDENLKPDSLEKTELRREIQILLKMKQLEEDHKVREVLALSYKHKNQELADTDLESEDIALDAAISDEWFPDYITWYPTTYTLVIVGTTMLMILAFAGYFKAPFKISGLSFLIGFVGFFVWVGLIELDRNFLHLGELLNAHRPAFNPFDELKSNPTWMWQFMAIRFTGLVIIVPFIEEFFLRGFLMRYIDDPDWDEIPLGLATEKAILGVVAYGIVAHLGEPLAAAAWFSMVTWLYLRTKSIWDCVVAHAVTNLLLGIFVCWSGKWYLW